MCSIKFNTYHRIFIKTISQANYQFQFIYLTNSSSISHRSAVFRTENNNQLIFVLSLQ